MKNKKTILLAEDHKLVRKGFSEILAQNDNYIVVAEAENGEELITEYLNYNPDIIISDISMPEKNGFEASQQINKDFGKVKLLFLSMYCDKEHIYKAIKSGAKGLINKNVDEKTLFFALDKISDGETYFPPFNTQSDIINLIAEMDQSKAFNPNSNVSLSTREKQILSFLTEGLRTKDIAEKLFLSKRTVDLYRSKLIQKLNLNSAAELIKYANNYKIENGLL